MICLPLSASCAEHLNTILRNYAQAVAQTCFVKKMFLKICQSSQENRFVGVSFIIYLLASGVSFPVNFAKF